jgi:glycosyltransferase involved in cell wall biosynthesis
LIKAYEYVLRHKYKQAKLILTGKYDDIPGLETYIKSHRLEFDIISLYHLPEYLLAALYAGAEFVINPSLYEGGFPFTFSEGMSVGTPSIMSRIPQVMEIMDRYDSESFLFDPYDWKDMAEKIVYAMDHRQEIIQKQEIIYTDLKRRTWDIVARDYVNAFKYFIAKEEAQSS